MAVGIESKIKSLEETLHAVGPLAVAVSGGVDSMTLAIKASSVQPDSQMFHAISPAVPRAATARVRQFAKDLDWNLQEIQAGEFKDKRYIGNPYNRCFFCKQNLYGVIRQHTTLPIVSGANLDDLDDFRPGLVAAKSFEVRHPYIESQMSKDNVRLLARLVGADSLSELPASPCLSSRVETGIEIDANVLRAIDSVESWIAESYSPEVVRCRVVQNGLRVELDGEFVDQLSDAKRQDITSKVEAEFSTRLSSPAVHFGVYEMGSAFVKGASDN